MCERLLRRGEEKAGERMKHKTRTKIHESERGETKKWKMKKKIDVEGTGWQ